MRHEGKKKLWFDLKSGPRLFWHNKIFVELNVLSLQSDLIASTLTHSQTVKQGWKQSAAMSCTFLIMFNESASQCVQIRVERERGRADRSYGHLRGVRGFTSVFLIVLISKQGGLPVKSQRPDVIISV